MELVRWPNPILTQKVKPVDGPVDPELIKKMFEIMYRYGGCGLAGPQVGLDMRMFVLNTKDKEMVFINPLLQSVNPDRGKYIETEGCLSLPGLAIPVRRYRQIHVEWIDENGKHRSSQYEGFMSRAWQHEYDHLDGKLILDQLPQEQKEKAVKAMSDGKVFRWTQT